jgi:hypothetical protein
MKNICTLVLLILIVPAAIADEVWDSTYGKVIYADDVGVNAHWTYEHSDRQGIIFIPGLAGMYSRRGNYEGYWAQQTSDTRCDYERPGIDNEPTYYWGKFHISFVDLAYPSRWMARWGYCEDAPTATWDGSPE